MKVDIAILGAGPAGMAAARLAAEKGASVALIDEQAAPGGQIYRSILGASEKRKKILGAAYSEGHELAAGIDHGNIKHIPSATIWKVGEDGTVTYSAGGKAVRVSADHTIVATGALERPMPVPGWTLPGVMMAGAAQILLKSSGMVPQNAVLAGAGPLLYLIAAQLIKAGAPPKALVETQTTGDFLAALKHLPGALSGWSYITKGRAMLAEIRAAGVPRHTGASDIRIEGDAKATGISFNTGGRRQRLDCDTVLLHCGVVPNTQVTRSLRLDHVWDGQQHCFKPAVDDWGQTALPAISVAGDGGGIGGAKAAALKGRLAALNALALIGRIEKSERDAAAPEIRAALAREMAVRPFLDRLYAPPAAVRMPADETVVCRCEEVTAGIIRSYVKLGCTGPNQTKAFGRTGMGPCQGRYCGLTVTEILAAENGLSQQEVGAYRIRSPLKPISLGELASLAGDDDGHNT